MASWDEIATAAPDLAAALRRVFDANGHKVMATIRRDGSPRLSGTEVSFHDGHMWLAGMPQSVKFIDLRRDPRVAVHSSPAPPDGWRGDAKVSGRAVEVVDGPEREAFTVYLGESPEGGFELFRLDLDEVVVITLSDPPEYLVIESWHEGRGVTRRERR